MHVLSGLGHGLDEAFFMLWDTLWALVLGFALSGAVQAFVSRGDMQRVLGDHRPHTLARASVLGTISSSCSYASAALAKSLFARGADFTASLVFMIASTNLVVELGIVLWLLIGWQFALAEFVGGAIMIVLLGLLVPRAIPPRWIARARAGLADDGTGTAPMDDTVEPDRSGSSEPAPLRERLRSRRGWADAAGYTIGDLTMLRVELLVGFVVAGFLSALVPAAAWRAVFVTGHGAWSSLENAVLGPLLAIVSFVCSVGNVPLAAALWHGGIGFGGVVAFVFADLITLPLLSIYRRYYGRAIALRMLVVFWATMTVAGLAVEYLFAGLGIPAAARPHVVVHTGFAWNYTTVLDLVALVAFAVLYGLHRTRGTEAGRFATDPVCSMQVEIANAAAIRTRDGRRIYFCGDHCAHRFDADPDSYARAAVTVPAGSSPQEHEHCHGGER